MGSKSKVIYMAWDAYNAGFIATANAIELFWQEQDVLIDELYYLHPSDERLSDKNIAQKRAFYGESIDNGSMNEEELKKVNRCRAIGISIEKQPKYEGKRITIQSIVHYQSIYDALVVLIQQEFGQRTASFQLHINVSSGTPQMHVVWLMLNATGYLPVGTQLWSSQWNRKKGRSTLEKINFKPKMWLSQVFQSKYLATQKLIINPDKTKSTARQEAEQLLTLFSNIPRATLLLLGERGTGKSTYVNSLIAPKFEKEKYAEVACGTFSMELMRSELFGYEKGAFTGADQQKKGILNKVGEGGLLFLDEIQDLSKGLQRQLVQVLQSKKYYPIGAREPIAFSPKMIVVASNLSFEALQSVLDADFLDRIAQYVVQIPSLRDCKEDLENAYKTIWERVANFEEAPTLVWNESISTYLKKQPFYGNYRDLEKFISYLLAFKIEQGNNTLVAIEKAVAYYEKWRGNTVKKEKYTYFKTEKTYKEIIRKFNSDLVEWATHQYGSIEEAAIILDRAVSTLYQDKRAIKKTVDKP